MSILPVTPDDVEFFTTVVNLKRYYSSSSLGVTGTINLFPRASKIEKEVRPLGNFEQSFQNDSDIELFRSSITEAAKQPNIVSIDGYLKDYLSKVNQQTVSAKKQKEININRFTPTTTFTSNTMRKLSVKDMLMSQYYGEYPTAQWAYTNYHCLSFFTSPQFPTSSVLLYPSVDNQKIPKHDGHVSGTYQLSGAFSFDFYINPRQRTDGTNGADFKAGTIFHLSSSYALSLLTGSSRDVNGVVDAFRLQLQLSHSADIAPSVAQPGSYPNNLTFLSDDNCLSYNSWHHVVVRWGTNIVNNGTGSFIVDGVEKGTFVVPSGTIAPKLFSLKDDPRVLCVGNFYEGDNTGLNSQLNFFGNAPSERDGTSQLIDNLYLFDEPASYDFRHPLNADVHDLSIRRHYMTDFEIQTKSGKGIETIDQDVAFYLPPFFVEQTPIRKEITSLAGTTFGGVLQTPFFTVDGYTDDPFNVAMAFGVGGHYINLENFVCDFSNKIWPKLHDMSASVLDYTTTALPANDFIYSFKAAKKRNHLVMPCDDGNFKPNFKLLKGLIQNKTIDALGRSNISIINLDNLLNQDSLLFGETFDANYGLDLVDQQIGFSPENPGIQPGPAVLSVIKKINNSISNDSYGPGTQKSMPLTIFQRTKDDSSNQVVFFDISNLFYGNTIVPKSFVITDNNLSGSGGRLSMTLRDDGDGNIYRADSNTKHCIWNSVGNIFYNEGVVVIKSPHLCFFGKNGYEMSFEGEQNLHSAKFSVLAPSFLLNSSSNPTYAPIKDELAASNDPTDNDVFVYISGVNFHDDNLNVIAKAVLAQPVIKREGEKLLFKIAFDF
jgi:hypothetical protein